MSCTSPLFGLVMVTGVDRVIFDWLFGTDRMEGWTIFR